MRKKNSFFSLCAPSHIYNNVLYCQIAFLPNNVLYCQISFLPLFHYCSLVPRPNPRLRGERVWFTSSDFLGLQDAKCHVILIIGMATRYLVCGSRVQ